MRSSSIGRSLVAIGISIAVALGMLVSQPGTAVAAQNVSDKDTLIVWDINIAIKNADRKWRTFFDRISDGSVYNRKPDIILAQDAPSADMGAFMNKLEASMGETNYSYRHASPTSETQGGNVVVFRNARFDVDSLTRWYSLQGKQECDRDGDDDAQEDKNMIAVRLADVAHGKKVVAASVHWGSKVSPNCVWRNIKRMENKIDTKWDRRRMTVVGGDFNERPDAEETGDTIAEWRMEQDPECWYRTLAESVSRQDCSKSFNNAQQGHYYDTVWEDQYGEDDDAGGSGDGIYDICQQWTTFNAKDGETCDQGAGGDEDRARQRIDYIWVRYENGDGSVAATYTDEELESFIPLARTDRGYKDGYSADLDRYSNHRGINAVLKWHQ